MGADSPFSVGKVSYIRALLIQAGYCEPRQFRLYLAIRILITVVTLGTTVLISGFKSPVLLFSVPTLAFYVTQFKLMRMVRGRQKRIRFGSIDALDMIALCVESGLPPLQAIKYVARELREKHPDLYDEFHILCHETAAGCSWDEALYSMSERTGLGEIRELSEMIRAEPIRFIEILRDCAHFLRDQYSQAKPRKMALALVVFGGVFVLPMILIVTFGPTLIELYRTLTSQKGWLLVLYSPDGVSIADSSMLFPPAMPVCGTPL